jgi:hypothetical protein
MDSINKKMEMATKRYGKPRATTRKATPKPKVKVKPKGNLKRGVTGIELTWSKKF